MNYLKNLNILEYYRITAYYIKSIFRRIIIFHDVIYVYRRGGRGQMGGVEMGGVVGRQNIIDRDYDFALYFCHSNLI